MDNNDTLPATRGDLRAVKEELESNILEQDHRLTHCLWNFFHRKKWKKGDIRREAVKKALFWSIFSLRTAAITTAGGVGVATIFIMVWHVYLMAAQNAFFQTQIIENRQTFRLERRTQVFEKLYQSNDKTAATESASPKFNVRARSEALKEIFSLEVLLQKNLFSEPLIPSTWVDNFFGFTNTDTAEASINSKTTKFIDLDDALLQGVHARDLNTISMMPVSLISANLSGARLMRAYLKGAMLEEANLSGANLSEAMLESANLSGADLSEADLGFTILRGAVLSGANLKGAELSEADLSGADLSGARFNGADLRSADLSGADLRGVILNDAKLRGVILSRADLRGEDLTGADLSSADLSSANLSRTILSETKLNGANLRGADLRMANLNGADLSEADLSGAHLSGAHLSGADLSRANLRGAHIQYANLERAILEGANLEGAYLTPESLYGANSNEAYFNHAYMRDRYRCRSVSFGTCIPE